MILMVAKMPHMLLCSICRDAQVTQDQGVTQCFNNRKACQGMLPDSFLCS